MSRADKISYKEMNESAVENLASVGMTIDQISAIFSISSDTFRRRMRENPKLAAAVSRGKNEGLFAIQNKAFELARGGNVSMIKYILGARGGWSEKQEVSVNYNSRSFDDLSDEELNDKTNQFINSVSSAIKTVQSGKEG